MATKLPELPQKKGREEHPKVLLGADNEMGVDWKEVSDLASERKKWKELTTSRMTRLEQLERSLGNEQTLTTT